MPCEYTIALDDWCSIGIPSESLQRKILEEILGVGKWLTDKAHIYVLNYKYDKESPHIRCHWLVIRYSYWSFISSGVAMSTETGYFFGAWLQRQWPTQFYKLKTLFYPSSFHCFFYTQPCRVACHGNISICMKNRSMDSIPTINLSRCPVPY